jgi:hypothetical protein
MTATLPRPEELLTCLAVLLDGEREIDRVPIGAIDLKGDGVRLEGRGRRFGAIAEWRAIDGDVPRWDASLEIGLLGDEPVDAGVVITLELGQSDESRWLVPGLFYGENRPAASRAHFPRWVAPGAPSGDDPFAASSWSFRVDRTAAPLVSVAAGGRAFTLVAEPWTAIGQAGIGFGGGGTGPGSEPIELRLSVPYREEPVVYDGGERPQPPDRPTHRWLPGEPVRIAFRLYVAADEPNGWAPALRDLSSATPASGEGAPLDLGQAAELACDGLLDWHYDAEVPAIYETAAFDREGGAGTAEDDRRAMHVGWLSGAPAAAALIAHGRRSGRADAEAAGRSVLDAICANLAPCGTFWGQWTAQHGWTKGWTRGDDALHGRTLAEATLFTLRAAAAVGDAPGWLRAAASNLRFVAGHQRASGALPGTWNGRTGDALSWDGSAALAWIPALIEGADALGEPPLRDAAAGAGAFYAAFVDREFLFGAPEDVDLGPTSEDGYVAVMAYVALAESAASAAERDGWLDVARRAAEWTLTFRYAWDVPFPPDSTLRRAGFRTAGLDLASPANQHLHTYGLICVPELVRLGQALGDAWLVRRARDNLAAARQVLASRDGEFGARRGMTPERYYHTRYGGPVGEIGRLSHAWCLGLLLWACEAAIAEPAIAGEVPTHAA